MPETGNLRFQIAVLLEDAVNLGINPIDTADASNKMVCVAIYARYLRRNGKYSGQLVFSRSKVVPDGIIQPRAELLASKLCKCTNLLNSKESLSRQSQRKCQIE